MRVRPGRTRSIIAGVMALLVTVVGAWMLASFGGMGGMGMGGGVFTIFLVLWVVVGLAGAAASFYNAFSARGLPLYEIDTEKKADAFCPRCGKPVSSDDQFCRSCGAPLQ